MLQKIHIAEARKIAERIDADAIIVVAFKGDSIVATSFGQTKTISVLTGDLMNALVDDLASGDVAKRGNAA